MINRALVMAATILIAALSPAAVGFTAPANADTPTADGNPTLTPQNTPWG